MSPAAKPGQHTSTSFTELQPWRPGEPPEGWIISAVHVEEIWLYHYRGPSIYRLEIEVTTLYPIPGKHRARIKCYSYDQWVVARDALNRLTPHLGNWESDLWFDAELNGV